MPARGLGKCLPALLQLRLRSADDVAAPRLAQPCEVLATRHSPVRDPDSPDRTVALLHRLDDLLQRRGIVRVAGKDLVAQGKPIEGHDQRDTHLLAVGPVIARVPALRKRVARRFPFKVRARHVIQKDLVLAGE